MRDNEEENLTTKLLLRIHAANLPRHGLLKTPPNTYAVVTSVSGRASRSGPDRDEPASTGNEVCMRTVEWGRTEIVYKHTHPQWTKTFTLNYEYGSECYFYVQVYRLNPNSKEEPVSLGNAVCEIGDILGSKNHTKVKRLPKGGVVFCRLEPIQESNLNCIFRFQFGSADLNVGRKGLSLTKFSSAPDTILGIAKRHPNATHLAWITVYRSSPVQESFNPTWDVGEIDLESICNGDLDRPLRLSVVVHKKNAQDITVAELETTLRSILNTQRDYNENELEVEQTKQGFRLQRSMQNPKMVGRLTIPLAQLIDTENSSREFDVSMSVSESTRVNDEDPYAIDLATMPTTTTPISDDPYAIDITTMPTPMAAPSTTTTATFQDYVNDGCLLDFCVAIDFTSSNGDPRIPGTLHDQSAYTMNDYEETIAAIGNAVAAYSDPFHSVWGFGAKFGDVTRHLCQCGPEPQVQGVEGILGAYKSMFQSDLTMSGPTLFDQVIQAAAVRANNHQKQQAGAGASANRYCVLLIITDGISQNMEETKRKLDVYSSVPLSVIFVGVGRSDFKSMHDLCERKNTTFVDFRHHQHDPSSLGRAALQHMPNQLVQYMIQRGI